MPTTIKDGRDSYTAEVTSRNQLSTVTVAHSLQHRAAKSEEQTYQANGSQTSVLATGQTLLHLTNNDPERVMAVAFIRAQVVYPDSVALPTGDTYLQVGFGEVYSSGGSAVVPTNTTAGSGKVASVTVYTDSPSTTGTFVEADREHPKSNGEVAKWSKEGAWIIPLGQTMSVRLVSANAGTAAWARVTFAMLDKDSL